MTRKYVLAVGCLVKGTSLVYMRPRLIKLIVTSESSREQAQTLVESGYGTPTDKADLVNDPQAISHHHLVLL